MPDKKEKTMIERLCRICRKIRHIQLEIAEYDMQLIEFM